MKCPPPHFDGGGVCGGFEAWLSDGGQRDPLMLEDSTMLVNNYPNTFVIRVRIQDGGSGELPVNLHMLDRSEVQSAKQKMVDQYLDEMMRLSPANRMAGVGVMNKMFGPEGLYRVLAGYFFSDKGVMGDKK